MAGLALIQTTGSSTIHLVTGSFNAHDRYEYCRLHGVSGRQQFIQGESGGLVFASPAGRAHYRVLEPETKEKKNPIINSHGDDFTSYASLPRRLKREVDVAYGHKRTVCAGVCPAAPDTVHADLRKFASSGRVLTITTGAVIYDNI